MRIAKWNVLILASALALSLLCAKAGTAASPAKQDQPQQATSNEKAQNAEVYRVNYKISELENGKTINSRSYSLMAKTDARTSTRVGSKIPVQWGGGTGIRYQDVGMNIDCTVRKQKENLLVHSDISMETVAEKEPTTSSQSPPVLRQLSLADDTVATVGKAAFVGSLDDVASNHRFVIEVTVTRAE